MANAQVLRNATVVMQASLGAAKTITAISKAAEAVVTATHDFIVGDLIVLSGIVGMVKMNNKVVRVKSVSTTVSFVCEGIDSTTFSTYVSGGTAEKVATTATFDNITNLSLPDDPPEEIDVTSIADTEKQIVFGMDAASKGSFSTIADPLATTSVELALARSTNTRRVFKITLQSGYVGIFNAYVAGGSGFDAGVGAAGTATISLTLRNPVQWFAS